MSERNVHSEASVLRVAALLPAFALVACGFSDMRDTDAQFSSRDSAGVTIAVNSSRATDLRQAFTVSAEPATRIGVVDGDEPYVFSSVRSLALLENGMIAVADGDTREIRIFDSHGTHVTTHGGAGQGPAEFQSLYQLVAAGGDTVLALNMPFMQPKVFTVAGGYVDTPAITGAEWRAALPETLVGSEGVVAMLPDRSMVTGARPPGDRPEWPNGQLFWPSNLAVWISSDRETTRVLGEQRGIEQMFVDGLSFGRAPVVPPTARRSAYTGGGSAPRFCMANNAAPQVECWSPAGQAFSIRWAQDSIMITNTEIEEWRESRRQNYPDVYPPADVEKLLTEVIIPPAKPPVNAIFVDADARLWVAGPDLKAEQDGWARWRMFDATGRLLGYADLPACGFRDARANRFAQVERDSDGVQFVVVRDLRR